MFLPWNGFEIVLFKCKMGLELCCNGVTQCFGRRAFFKLARDAVLDLRADLKSDVHVNKASLLLYM